MGTLPVVFLLQVTLQKVLVPVAGYTLGKGKERGLTVVSLFATTHPCYSLLALNFPDCARPGGLRPQAEVLPHFHRTTLLGEQSAQLGSRTATTAKRASARRQQPTQCERPTGYAFR